MEMKREEFTLLRIGAFNLLLSLHGSKTKLLHCVVRAMIYDVLSTVVALIKNPSVSVNTHSCMSDCFSLFFRTALLICFCECFFLFTFHHSARLLLFSLSATTPWILHHQVISVKMKCRPFGFSFRSLTEIWQLPLIFRLGLPFF